MALKKLSTFRILVVFLVWLGAMGLLFKREIYPSLVPGENRIGRLEELSPALVRDQWMGIYYRDRQVGYSHTALFPHKEDGFYGSALENTLWLDLPLPGRSSRVRLHSRVLIDTSGTIDEARRLWEWVDRPNALIKVPATTEGLPAIQQPMIQVAPWPP